MTALSALPGGVAESPARARAAVRAGVIGNLVDQAHIFLPTVVLIPALPHLVGRAALPGTAVVVVVATMLGRPVGSVIFGLVADAAGRTRTTQVAILGTAVTTAALALLPPSSVIGGSALTLMLLLRFAGGVFLAGEYTSAIPLAMEWSRPRARGGVSGLIMAMSPLAQSLLALTSAGLLMTLGPQAYAAWGWRVCFLAGALASLVVLVLYRRQVRDRPEVTGELRQQAASASAGASAWGRLTAVLAGEHRGQLWRLFGLMSGLWLMTNMVVLHLSVVLTSGSGLPRSQVALAFAGAGVLQAIAMAGVGELSTVLGRRRTLIIWGLLAAAVAPVTWWWMTHQHELMAIALGGGLLQALTVAAYGPMGAYLAEGFPAPVRSTGYGAAYSLSIVLPALHTLWLPPLVRAVGEQAAVSAVLVLGGLLVAGCAFRETPGHDERRAGAAPDAAVARSAHGLG